LRPETSFGAYKSAVPYIAKVRYLSSGSLGSLNIRWSAVEVEALPWLNLLMYRVSQTIRRLPKRAKSAG
jgi:hypothetical protein